ncbi:MAG: ABC transporter ATP-binding protein [Lachnospiraceae bacterium]|nr:ABC transporter ATP-binding protein [Lachnospiraceae bacterium]MDY4971582.1 ABC transporter ATP-binding protein [Lachnospiraceae bacterium]
MVELNNVSKILRRRQVLDHVNYEFEYGKVYGLYGPNGSGKTMILRVLAGLVIPTEGEVLIDGKKLHRDISFPPETGLIIENMELIPQYTAVENLRLLAQINKTASEEDIRESLDRVGLSSELPVKKFSLGMKQRLNIAQAIFEKPRLILLDEASNALDEKGIEMLHRIVKDEKKRGACIIMATHNKSDMEQVCDRILKISEGKMEG